MPPAQRLPHQLPSRAPLWRGGTGAAPGSLRPRNAQVTTERALRRPAPASSDPNVRSVPSESSSGSRQRIPPPANHSYQALLRPRSAGPAPDDEVTTFPLSSLKATAAACPDGLQPAAPVLRSEQELLERGQQLAPWCPGTHDQPGGCFATAVTSVARAAARSAADVPTASQRKSQTGVLPRAQLRTFHSRCVLSL